MKISGGSARGRRTARKLDVGARRGGKLRPTSAKVREALFDILRGRIEGATFVDLYAGTGTVGLESLSRGAAKAVFIDPDPVLTEAIERDARDFAFSERARIIRGTAEEFLERASSAHERYDIFFIDPPYHSQEIERVLPIIGRSDIMPGDGIIVVEHYFKKKLPDRVGFLRMQRIYRYGDTMLTLYRRTVE